MPRKRKMGFHRGSGQFVTKVNGRPHYLGSDPREARRRFWLLTEELTRARGEVAPKPVVAKTALLAWLKQHDIIHPRRAVDLRNRLAPFERWLGDRLLADLTSNCLTSYLAYLRLEGWHWRGRRGPYAPNTLRSRIWEAHGFLEYCRHEGWCQATEFTVPELPPMQEMARDVDPALVAGLLESLAGSRSWPIVAFIAATGCRPSEACHLQWQDVRLDEQRCTFNGHKTAESAGRSRTIYLGEYAIRILEAQPHASAYVFPNRHGRLRDPALIARVIRQRAGITTYQLRHTYAQVLSEQVTEQVLARLLGHRSTRTTRRYYDVRDKRAADAATRAILPQLPPAPSESSPLKPKPKRRAKRCRPKRR